METELAKHNIVNNRGHLAVIPVGQLTHARTQARTHEPTNEPTNEQTNQPNL